MSKLIRNVDLFKANGFTIDDHSSPPVVYKGPRFAPTEWHFTYTELEHELMTAMNASLKLLDNGDYLEAMHGLAVALVNAGVRVDFTDHFTNQMKGQS